MGRRHATNAACGRFLVVDTPRFFGEPFADIFGVLANVSSHPHPHLLQHLGRRRPRRRLGRR